MRAPWLTVLALLVLGCVPPRRSDDGTPDPTADAGSATCGNGRLDPGEACDPEIGDGPGSCPSGCDDQDPCTEDALQGTPEECTARCEQAAVVACAGDDGCCPSGCAGSDTDCASCRDECASPGARRCEGNAVSTCGNHDGDACLEWGAAVACGAAQACNAGLCEDTCTADCTTSGARKCDETGALVVCEDPDGDGCLKWSAPFRCPAPQVCAAGSCALDCRDECTTAGAKRCVAGGTAQYETCAEHDQDGCLEWGAAQSCTGGLVCANGGCESACRSTCTTAGARQCQNGGAVTCGDYNQDGCLEWGTETPCSSAETCIDGACQPKPSPGKVVINEVVYDAVGADTEVFVELHGPAGMNLAGYSLVGVNGSGGATYNQLALVGSIGGDGYYVVAHANASATLKAGADQLDAKVDFQNGPDGLQLRWGDGVVDALGYGAFGAADVFAGEGRAAPGVDAGHGLGRDALHADTDDNAADFRDRASPTPGADNEATAPVGPVCGNGSIESGEVCDGDCPTSCDDGNACTTDTATGTVAACTAACTRQAVTRCVGGDGCCPAGCQPANDGDCSPPCLSAGASCSWTVESIEPGFHPAIALDGADDVHVAFGRDALLKYARRTAIGWEPSELLHSGGSSGPSIVVDPTSQVVRIANGEHYLNADELSLYERSPTVSWDATSIATGCIADGFAVAPDGLRFFSYYDIAGKDLFVARWRGNWVFDIVRAQVDTAGDVGSHSSVATDAQGNLHVAYYDTTNHDLKYATWSAAHGYAPADISRSVVDSTMNVGQHPVLVLDPSGKPGIVYDDVTRQDLKYAHWNGTGWDVQLVDGDGQDGSLAFDASGNPTISYTSRSTIGIRLAHWNGSAWNVHEVDPAGYSSALAFDSHGNPHVVYVQRSSGAVTHARYVR